MWPVVIHLWQAARPLRGYKQALTRNGSSPTHLHKHSVLITYTDQLETSAAWHRQQTLLINLVQCRQASSSLAVTARRTEINNNLMVVTHSQENCARNLHKFLAQVSWLCVTTISHNYKMHLLPEATVVELNTRTALSESLSSAVTRTLLVARTMLTLTVKSAPRLSVFGANTRYVLQPFSSHASCSTTAWTSPAGNG